MIWRSLAVAFGLVAAVFVVLELGPAIEPRHDLPEEFAELTESTWNRFEAAFPAQSGCLTDVELELVPEVAVGAAEYLVAEQLIRIEVPTSPRRYVETLTHELAHHIDAVCDGEFTIGSVFRVAQGLGPETSWECVDAWGKRPMEHFAETVVEYVTAERHSHSDIIEVSPAALDIVRNWATETA